MKKLVGWCCLIGGWMTLGTVFNPPIASREWFITLVAIVAFGVSGSIFTAASINQWPWDVES